MSEELVSAGLRRIWLRYHNMKFICIFAAVIAIAGAVLFRVTPVVSALIELLAISLAYFIWWRYVSSPCPNCGKRFASFWGKFVFGFLKPTKCQSCGLSAGEEKNWQ